MGYSLDIGRPRTCELTRGEPILDGLDRKARLGQIMGDGFRLDICQGRRAGRNGPGNVGVKLLSATAGTVKTVDI
jgi:hypothetical protein